MTGRVGGLLLAAGAGRRFGMPKALVEHRGGLLVETAAAVLAAGGCRPVVVVLGAQAQRVRAGAKLSGCVLVDNLGWAEGMGSSLRAGLDAMLAEPVLAVLVLPVDVPGVTAEAVRRVAEHAAPEALARASYHGAPGHPVLIGREHWQGVRAAASGDVGARDYLLPREVLDIPCEDIATGLDVDRPADLESFTAQDD